MANDVIKSGKAEASQLKTVSNVFDEASDSDERRYIKLVEQKIACTGHYIREDEYRMFASLLDGIGQTIPNPITNFADYYIRLNQLMCEDGGRVLLSGKGGDEILCSARDPSPELSDLLYKLKLISLHRRLKVWRRLLKKSYGDVLWRRALLPLMPEVIQGSWKRRLHPELFELYDRNFSRIMKLSRRRLGPRDVFGHRYPSGQDQAKSFLRIVRVLSAGYWKEFGNAEITYPFTHRPLVEFMHATPFDQRVRPGETRSLLRRAMRDLLPVEIANRRGKTLNTQAALLGVRREWSRLHQMFADPLICTNGYIDREVLRSKVLLAKDGNDLAALSLWFLIPLEHWLQSLARRT
jgi:asparagine synthase (glutamine-hydrolysing)